MWWSLKDRKRSEVLYNVHSFPPQIRFGWAHPDPVIMTLALGFKSSNVIIQSVAEVVRHGRLKMVWACGTLE